MGLSTGAATAPAREPGDEAIAEARQRKIEALREQYRNGAYQASAAAISAKLVELLLRR